MSSPPEVANLIGDAHNQAKKKRNRWYSRPTSAPVGGPDFLQQIINLISTPERIMRVVENGQRVHLDVQSNVQGLV